MVHWDSSNGSEKAEVLAEALVGRLEQWLVEVMVLLKGLEGVGGGIIGTVLEVVNEVRGVGVIRGGFWIGEGEGDARVLFGH